MGVAHTQPADARVDVVRSWDPADFPVPTGREEAWRFTPLARLRGLADGSAVAAEQPVAVTVDAEPGVLVETVPAGPGGDPRLRRTGAPDDVVAARAAHGAGVATVVTLPREHVGQRPTVVTVAGEAGSSSTGASLGHVLVEAEPFARGVVVLEQVGSATYADLVEVVVGDGADLTLVSVQDWADDAVHVGRHQAVVGRDARLRHVVVTLGGDLVRLCPTVAYSGPGGEAELLGLYFADPGQHLEHRLLVDHGVPSCRSDVAYKGALQGEPGREAHTVWIGDVVIRPEAVGTDTYEINRNLVLTDFARADSVPNLEIETGEVVGAGHASTTGRFDDEQVFYLQSRGISADEARRLVVRGFFAEILQRIGVPELAERLLASVDAELAKGVTA